VRIRIDDESLRYTAEQSLLCYFPDERPAVDCHCGSRGFTVTILQGARRGTGRARASPKEQDTQRTRRQALGIAFYRAVVDLTGGEHPWGALTGIRPARVADRLLSGGMTAQEAGAYLRKRYGVEPRRVKLAFACAETARAVEGMLRPDDVGLYVGIPFCPSKCAYCSFVSQAIEKKGKLLPAYLDALERELDAISITPRCVYIGGGTPTVLSAGQLDRLLGILRRGGNLPLAPPIEVTVEAGRPDTITRDKLDVMAAYGVNRISVNPQSMDDAVLRAIGRRHTAADTLRAAGLVRRAGFKTLNMDLIAGLPGDTPEGLLRSLRAVMELRPENITLHTLARKRGAGDCRGDRPRPPAETYSAINACHDLLRAAGYAPYYLYRQKFMAAGCENTGWSLPGHASIYNIVMMEELRGVRAAGAGGVTKLCRPGGRIERVFNPKYPAEYLRDIERIVKKKRECLPHAEL
jgi:oxygen-independent coproporphyrinogen-3 oxidase